MSNQGNSLAGHAIDYEDYVQNFSVAAVPTQGDQCAICLSPAIENDQRTMALHCRHPELLYHENCILTWLRPSKSNPGNDKNSCPICRATLWAPLEYDPDDDDLYYPDDYTRNFPEFDDSQLWAPTLEAVLRNVSADVCRSLEDLFGDTLSEDVVQHLTGIDVTNTDDKLRFSKANRMLYCCALLESTHYPEFIHLVRRGIITSRILEHYYGEIEPEDWMALVADLKACLSEVRSLDGNTVSFMNGFPMSGAQIWENIMQTKSTIVFGMDFPISRGARILTSYRKSGDDSDAIRKIEYTLYSGINVLAGYNPKINIQIVNLRFLSEFRIMLRDLNVISGLRISKENREIIINLMDGHQIDVRY